MTVTTELSPMEQKVMVMLADGCAVKEVARRLCIHSETVSTHVRRAATKLGATTPRKAVVAFIRSQYAGWAGELEFLSWG